MRMWRVPYPKFGDGPGLERVATVADKLGIDLAAFGAEGAVMVGSNGKGSTAAMTAALLSRSSRSVGLFTSPHLLALNERFRIDGEDITDEDLQSHWDHVGAAVDACGLAPSMGGFEFLFLIAADWFAARRVAHTVWEAGIGGRLDPVSLIKARQLALTSLDFEHTALLGDTLAEIAREKLGAAPQGSTVFAPENLVERNAVEAFAAQNGVRTKFVAPFESAPLAGAHQCDNAALAVSLAQHIVPLNADQIRLGLDRVRWPGRLELISDEPLIIIDVGHTPAGVRAAFSGFKAMTVGRESILVCGSSIDKNAHALIGELAPHFATIICAAAHHKGAPVALIASIAAHVNPAAEMSVAEGVADARKLALARGANGAIYVAGGLFLAAEFKAVHLGRDPALLAFF